MEAELSQVYSTSENKSPPKKAKYRVLYWNREVWFQYLDEAMEFKDNLPYYQWESAEIEKIKK